MVGKWAGVGVGGQAGRLPVLSQWNPSVGERCVGINPMVFNSIVRGSSVG